MTVRNNTCAADAMQRQHENFMHLLHLAYEDFDYDFSRVKFNKGIDSTVQIRCPKHGWINTRAKKLLAGRGCITCNEKSLMDHGAMVYIIRCFDENEDFYKIGITTKSVDKRFCYPSSLPYNYEILSLQNGDRKKLYNFEKLLHEELRELRYIPKKYFTGATECFSNIMPIRNKYNIFDVFGIDTFKCAY